MTLIRIVKRHDNDLTADDVKGNFLICGTATLLLQADEFSAHPKEPS